MIYKKCVNCTFLCEDLLKYYQTCMKVTFPKNNYLPNASDYISRMVFGRVLNTLYLEEIFKKCLQFLSACHLIRNSCFRDKVLHI